MITLASDIEIIKGRHAVRFRRHYWSTRFFAARFGKYKVDHVFVIAIFPIWFGIWRALVFIKFWKQASIE